MQRLADHALIYGRLLTVNQAHLVERYNKALLSFGLPATKLTDFQIDRTGYSPEVAKELGDREYLDPNGVNRRFIILTPAQAQLPVVHTAFSNTSQLMYAFFEANKRAINALTIRDVIYGEIEDSVAVVKNLQDLLAIEEVSFNVMSAENVLGKAGELRGLIDRLKTEPDMWRDDAMLEHMVALAQITGDIRENTMVPDQVVFRHDAFWTSHFGGAYVFIDEKHKTIIADQSASGFKGSHPWTVSFFDRHDIKAIYDFLARTNRIELPRASWTEGAGYLEHRAEMAIRQVIAKVDPDIDLNKIDEVWLQTWMHRNSAAVLDDGDYPFLLSAKRRLASTGRIDMRELSPRERFQVVRANPEHHDAWLVNRLISDFVPADFVSRYVFNKPVFYETYENYPESYRSHVVDTLKTIYLKDKTALRKRLYGLD